MARPTPGGREEKSIRVLIVDDQRLFAEAISFTLQGMGITVIGVESTAEAAMRACRKHEPDLVLIDIGLPDQSGITVGRRILEERPDTRVVALTVLEDEDLVREALSAGFSGFLTKDTVPDHLARALSILSEGQTVIPQRLKRGAVPAPPEWNGSPHEQLLVRQLTPREFQVLGLLTEGATGPEIARRLRISPNTVRTHIQGILTKLQVHSRLEAASFAVRHRIVQSSRSAENAPSA